MERFPQAEAISSAKSRMRCRLVALTSQSKKCRHMMHRDLGLIDNRILPMRMGKHTTERSPPFYHEARAQVWRSGYRKSRI